MDTQECNRGQMDVYLLVSEARALFLLLPPAETATPVCISAALTAIGAPICSNASLKKDIRHLNL